MGTLQEWAKKIVTPVVMSERQDKSQLTFFQVTKSINAYTTLFNTALNIAIHERPLHTSENLLKLRERTVSSF